MGNSGNFVKIKNSNKILEIYFISLNTREKIQPIFNFFIPIDVNINHTQYQDSKDTTQYDMLDIAWILSPLHKVYYLSTRITNSYTSDWSPIFTQFWVYSWLCPNCQSNGLDHQSWIGFMILWQYPPCITQTIHQIGFICSYNFMYNVSERWIWGCIHKTNQGKIIKIGLN